MKSILDPSFRYVSSLDTDLRKTFARIREELRLPEPTKARPKARTVRLVMPIRAQNAG